MSFIADLHIHSHFSRATAKNLNPENLALWAQKKGISVIGTGDFTHPGWISELQEKLVDEGNGLYTLCPKLVNTIEQHIPESCRRDIRFLLSGEISCIYKRDGKTRKVHHLILMPDFESVRRLNKRLDQVGNITSDGRPILGLDSRDLLAMTLESSEKAFFIPAHIWTPWFSVFGSKSGFDSLEECFGDLTSYIHALETGLSSDPPMNRLLSALDDYLLVSNSDAHSPAKLGREANIFDTGIGYDEMIQAMTTKRNFLGTIEFYPEEGKYHLDGHRKCRIRFEPGKTREFNGICPVCNRPLTVGVLNRVMELADREGPKSLKGFSSLIPLPEILSEILGCGPATKTVNSAYDAILNTLGPELDILMEVNIEDIKQAGGLLLSEAIDRMRKGRVIREGGYDGEFGVIRLFREREMAEIGGQGALFPNPKITRKKIDNHWTKAVSQKNKEEISEEDPDPLNDPIIDILNEEQREAITHPGGHLQIIAGPGTGKTMTLTHRIAHVIRSGQVAPKEVLAITFTNKAAKEIRKRIDSLLPEGAGKKISVNTFHGFCLSVLRDKAEYLNIPKDFSLCSERDAILIARQASEELGKGQRFSSNFLKSLPILKMLSILDYEKGLANDEFSHVFKIYEQRLRNTGMLDLDDLELLTIKLFRDYPDVCIRYAERYKRIFVDEYQDTNLVQASIIKEIIDKGKGEIFAIGDSDQAIYGFRGADLNNFYRFSKDFPGVRKIMLTINYRSTQIILDGASRVIGNAKPLTGVADRGEPILIAHLRSQAEEAEMVVEQIEKMIGGTSHFSFDSGRISSSEENSDIGFGDIAVLFRINSQGDSFEESFSRAGIPYIRSGEKPLIDQYPVDVIWRFLQVFIYKGNRYYLDCYNNTLKHRKIRRINGINGSGQDLKPKDFIDFSIKVHDFDLSADESVRSIDRLTSVAENFDGDLISFLDALSIDRGIDHSGFHGDRVALMSIHAAKGLEWPIVFITGCEDGLIPCSLFGESDISEEKRLFYVGMTRACKKLILSHSGNRKIMGRVFKMQPSPLLSLISAELIETLEKKGWKSRAKSYKQLELFKL